MQNQLGLLYLQKGSPLALEYFNNALRIDKNNPDVMYNIAFYYQKSKNYAVAIPAYKTLLSKYPKYKEAYYNIGAINLEVFKKIEDATKYFNDAILADSSYAEAYYARGVCFEKEKKYDLARADYTKALELKPNFSFAIESINKIEGK